MCIGDAGSVAHQTASFGKLTLEIARKHPMVSRQRNELYAAVVGKRVGTDQDRINWLLRKACKDRIDLATTAGVEDFDLLPNGQRSEEHTSELQSLRHLVCRLLLEK